VQAGVTRFLTIGITSSGVRPEGAPSNSRAAIRRSASPDDREVSRERRRARLATQGRVALIALGISPAPVPATRRWIVRSACVPPTSRTFSASYVRSWRRALPLPLVFGGAAALSYSGCLWIGQFSESAVVAPARRHSTLRTAIAIAVGASVIGFTR
jgi:hypothetical protein